MPTVSARWQAKFGKLPPIGYVLRDNIPSRWLRIHSLPDSKRYPTSDLERQLLLARHNKVASHMLGSSGDFIVFLRFGEARWARELQHRHPKLSLTPEPDLAYYDQDGEVPFNFLAAELIWSPSGYDQLLLDIADDIAPSAVFYSPSLGSIYAPYDGGADIFPPKATDIAKLRAKWRDWLPANEEGL